MAGRRGKTGGGRGTNQHSVKGVSSARPDTPVGVGLPPAPGGTALAAPPVVDLEAPFLGQGVRINGVTWMLTDTSDGRLYGKQVSPKPAFPIEGHLDEDQVLKAIDEGETLSGSEALRAAERSGVAPIGSETRKHLHSKADEGRASLQKAWHNELSNTLASAGVDTVWLDGADPWGEAMAMRFAIRDDLQYGDSHCVADVIDLFAEDDLGYPYAAFVLAETFGTDQAAYDDLADRLDDMCELMEKQGLSY